MNIISRLKTIIYMILFTYQCLKLTIYSTVNLAITLVHVFILKTIETWKNNSPMRATIRYTKNIFRNSIL
jgi:hypothetical protein